MSAAPTDEASVGALNRIADAIFACAKEQRQANKLSERAVACSEGLYELGKANMGVSRALEQKLLSEGVDNAGSVD